MLRRFIPLLFAGALAFAPVALDTCQGSCALHAAMRAATPAPTHPAGTHAIAAAHQHGGQHTTHSCHEITAPPADTDPQADTASPAPQAITASQALTGGPHSCAHSDDLPLSAGALLLVSLTPPLVVASVLDAPVYGHSAHLTAHADAAGLSARIRLTTQLRV